MNNKKVLELVSICLVNGYTIKINPKLTYITISFKRVGLGEVKVINHVITGTVTDSDIECVRTIVSMLNAGDSVADIEKFISEFVPF